MTIDEHKISSAIVKSYYDELIEYLKCDVIIVGAGPSGLIAAYYLAKAGIKTAVIERKLSVGGGMWGGGMMFNKIVVQEESVDILNELNISHKEYEKGYYVADSVECVSSLTYHAMKAGAKIFNLISVEDVMIRNGKVEGVVINWSSTEIAGLHVDPITMDSKYVIDATGHPMEVLKIIERKNDVELNTPDGKIKGECSMWADVAEGTILNYVKEVFPNVYVTGMAANAVFGAPRMGPIFGGMLLSGKKVAELIIQKLK